MSTLLETDVLGFQQAFHQPYLTDLAPLDCVYFPNLKSYLQGTQFNHRTKISHAIEKMQPIFRSCLVHECLPEISGTLP